MRFFYVFWWRFLQNTKLTDANHEFNKCIDDNEMLTTWTNFARNSNRCYWLSFFWWKYNTLRIWSAYALSIENICEFFWWMCSKWTFITQSTNVNNKNHLCLTYASMKIVFISSSKLKINTFKTLISHQAQCIRKTYVIAFIASHMRWMNFWLNSTLST